MVNSQPPTQANSYNLLTQNALINPYPIYKKMREEDPVHWSEPLQAWVLTRYEEVEKALFDPRLSSERLEPLAQLHLQQLDLKIVEDYLRVFGKGMVMRDPPEHIRLRKIASQGFTHKALANWQPMIQTLVNDLLNKVQTTGTMDIVGDFTEPLPAIVIAEMFGVPTTDRDNFQKWSNNIAKFVGGSFGNLEEDAKLANEGIIKLESYFKKMLAVRQKQPGNDLMSLLLAGYEEGKMDEEELCAQCVLILVAGHVTTVYQLANGIHAFLQHPEQLKKLQDNPHLIDSAVEEVLRYQTSVVFVHRVAKQELEIKGQLLREGQIVFLGLAAANHDDEVFEAPDQFDITRKGNKHLSFIFGPHLCLGAHLARMELKMGLQTLFKRMPNLRLAENQPPQFKRESLLFRGFHSLPVVF